MIYFKITVVYGILNINELNIFSPSQTFWKLLGLLLSEGELIFQEYLDIGFY